MTTRIARTLAATNLAATAEIARSLIGCAVHAQAIQESGTRRPNPHAPTVEIDGDAHVLLEIPGSFAAWIVDRALGGEAQLSHVDAGLSLRDAASLGVLAYVMARVLQTLPGHFQVQDVFGDGSALRSTIERSHPSCLSLRLQCEGVEVPVYLWVVRGPQTLNTQPTQFNPGLTRHLMQQRAVLSAQLTGSCAVHSKSAGSLLIDDVIVLSAPGIARSNQGYVGLVMLKILGTRIHSWRAQLREDRMELLEMHTTEDDHMTAGKTDPHYVSPDSLQPVADAPLELSVEIARFTLPLAEIATLVRGEVLLTGRPIGEHVTLRVGTRAIATGEMVNVDGAIGVRIVSLADR